VIINKLVFSEINSVADKTEFERLLQKYGYNYCFTLNQKSSGFMVDSPLVINSFISSFFYSLTRDFNEPTSSDKIRFVSRGEPVIIDEGFVVLYCETPESVQLFSQDTPHIVGVNTLPPETVSLLSDYAQTHNDYYLGYEKRYAEVYNRGGTTWEATTPNQSLLNILSGNPGFFSDKKVIDLGCGEGRDSLYLSSLGIDIVGVDISHSALNKARELARMDNIKAKFVETNVLYLNDIPDNYFDTAINMGCLHMIVNEEERISHLKNVYRILKPGGIFIIDHCQENWGKGFFSLPGELYNKDKLVVGNVIERRIRTAHGEMNIPLEVIPYSEMKADALTDEVCSTGFESKFVILSDTEAFGNSALIVFQKAS
jgi:SAM-dependent methyltransferase